MKLLRKYHDIINGLVFEVLEEQSEKLTHIIKIMYNAIMDGNVIHLFGTGHSHILAEECFFRAGGFVPVNAIFEESLMLHAGAMSGSNVERLSGYANIILNKYNTKKGDILFIFSNSGINNVPVEMALAAKEKELTVIAVTCLKHSLHEKSRHASGKKLYEVADYYIDNCGEIGDASIPIGMNVKVAPTSTVIGAIIMHGLFAEVANAIVKSGKMPPVYLSANIAGGSEHNTALIENYKNRLKHLI